ncbi:alpha/beta fold hydrolase [Pyxidicoccus fallax]|uniref:Bifunctional alpha/beta hydrolase/OsmC family protein n=1 Tax=Pyxidicoccus fallax TaxID=394095 RepID=A0A848LUQ3_9BACT|nr:alpha/beta fold hydrolase [Pyxidicoccus fallax]NMO21506.1 bifunctional alpha/beta hydrolase/OsmC family protein [Pyxidicoccus fallax]NPC81950.1 alpha/beta fold hydrolase [Pyxidicoccus fallax]
MGTRAVELRGPNGVPVTAKLELPPGRPAASAVLVSCFACLGESHGTARLCHALVSRGFAVLRLDFTASPTHDGTPRRPDTVPSVDAVVEAAAWLRGHYPPARLLVGHSLGGTAAAAALPRLPEVAALAVVNAPSGPEPVLERLPSHERELREGDISLGPGRLRLTRGFVRDIDPARVAAALGGFPGAVLALHAPEDRYVSLEHPRRLVAAARRPASLVMLDGADHFLSREVDAGFAADVLGPWAARHVTPVAEREAPLPPGVVEVHEAGEGRFAQDVRVGRHRLRVDEPLGLGGEDTGPTPYGLLSAALGACTAMTLRLYAARKGWPLEHVHVRLSHDKVHAQDCANCESKVGRVDRLARTLKLTGPLTEEQRAKLMDIADRCPVHRTLESEVDVRTELEE